MHAPQGPARVQIHDTVKGKDALEPVIPSVSPSVKWASWNLPGARWVMETEELECVCATHPTPTLRALEWGRRGGGKGRRSPAIVERGLRKAREIELSIQVEHVSVPTG